MNGERVRGERVLTPRKSENGWMNWNLKFQWMLRRQQRRGTPTATSCPEWHTPLINRRLPELVLFQPRAPGSHGKANRVCIHNAANLQFLEQSLYLLRTTDKNIQLASGKINYTEQSETISGTRLPGLGSWLLSTYQLQDTQSGKRLDVCSPWCLGL